MRHKPNHTCLPTFKLLHACAGCAFELGDSLAKRKSEESAKYVWMVVGSDIPCDIRRYSFSHEEGIAQLSHTNDFKDYTGGIWTLYKLVRVNKTKKKTL